MIDYRKLSYRLIIVAALCLMAVPSLALPAVAQGETAYINLSVTIGVPGDAVTVTGSNFTAGEKVDIYFGTIWRAEATVTTGRSFVAVIDVPNTYRGIHTIRAEVSATIYAETNFTVQSGLTASPESGQVGDIVTVVGRGYGQNETGIELYFGGQRVAADKDIEADADGFWSESFTIPPSVRGTHKIDTSPTATRHATFTVGPGISLDPTSGSPGQSITVTGGGFVAGESPIKILFDGEELETGIEAGNRGQWEESFDVPEMPAGEYEVTAEGHQTKNVPARTFNIVPGIDLSPDEGHVGMNVTATGMGFAANAQISIFYDDIEVPAEFMTTTNTTNEKGTFEAILAVPESRHGPRQVTAEDGEGNETEVPAIFTMEDDPPDTPELYSPVDGQRVGHVFKVRPQFQWEEVFDLSGVYYSLQISTSANITDDGDFADPVLTKERLTGNYTLEKDDALPHGTYYWIVKAVDGAENKSEWSDPESFRAGRLPLWAFIVIIVFAVLGAGAAGYYFAVKRRMYD